MSVRAKFVCQEITTTKDGATIKMFPVIRGSAENASFYEQTPAGSVVLATINRDAAAQFEPGAEYYLDITRAE